MNTVVHAASLEQKYTVTAPDERYISTDQLSTALLDEILKGKEKHLPPESALPHLPLPRAHIPLVESFEEGVAIPSLGAECMTMITRLAADMRRQSQEIRYAESQIMVEKMIEQGKEIRDKAEKQYIINMVASAINIVQGAVSLGMTISSVVGSGKSAKTAEDAAAKPAAGAEMGAETGVGAGAKPGGAVQPGAQAQAAQNAEAAKVDAKQQAAVKEDAAARNAEPSQAVKQAEVDSKVQAQKRADVAKQQAKEEAVKDSEAKMQESEAAARDAQVAQDKHVDAQRPQAEKNVEGVEQVKQQEAKAKAGESAQEAAKSSKVTKEEAARQARIMATSAMVSSINALCGGLASAVSAQGQLIGGLADEQLKYMDAAIEKMRANMDTMKTLEESLMELIRKALATQEAIAQNSNQTRTKILG